MWDAVFLLAVAGTAFADPQFIFPEDAPMSGSRIVSGWEAEPGQFPYQLGLRMVTPAGGVFGCGGSILTPEWGLTAAHCTAGRVTIVIRAGTLNQTQPSVIFETTKYYNYPLYNEAIPGIVQPHDIGLLEFGRTLTFSELIQPIRIQRSSAKNQNYAGVQAIASGWGNTWTQGFSPENLNWVYLRLVSNEECRAAYGGSSIITDSTICTRGYNSPTQSTCQGDSGGPLTTIDDDGAITQVGVTSFVSGLGCHAGIPSGFIRPGHYLDWLEEVTGVDFDWEYEPESETTDTPDEDGTTIDEEDDTTEKPEDYTTYEPEDDMTDGPEDYTTYEPEDDTTDGPEDYTTYEPEDDTTDGPEDYTTYEPEDNTTDGPEDYTTYEPEDNTTDGPEDYTTGAPDEDVTDGPESETTIAPESDESGSSSQSSESGSSSQSSESSSESSE